jgi:hypothetical protein
MQHELVIDGSRFRDYDGFVEEFNRAYVAAFGGRSWNGEYILDFCDLLEAAQDATEERLAIRWTHSAKSISELGYAEMAKYWSRKLALLARCEFSPSGYEAICRGYLDRLDQAKVGQGRTLFEFLVWQLRGDGDDPGDGDYVDLTLE